MMAVKRLERARVHIHSTYNNTILTLTDLKGDVITWASPGLRGFRGSKKGTPYAAQLATELIIHKLRELGVRSILVTVDGTGSGGRNSAINALKASGIRIDEVRNVTPVPHNNLRRR